MVKQPNEKLDEEVGISEVNYKNKSQERANSHLSR